jgi:hypothetical protein
MFSASQPSQTVPATKKRSLTKFDDLLSLARDYNLENEARRDLNAKGEGIIRKAKPALFRHATEHGVFSKTWSEISNIAEPEFADGAGDQKAFAHQVRRPPITRPGL